MLKIHVDTSHIKTFNPNIEKGFYAHVYVTSHPSHCLLLTPMAYDSPKDRSNEDRLSFYISMMAMADSDNSSTQTAHICHINDEELRKKIQFYVPRSGTISPPISDFPYLCIIIYEESTIGIPSENPDIDSRIANSLNIPTNHNSANSLTGLSVNRELLYSLRVGNLFVPWIDLLKCAEMKDGSTIDLNLNLIDDRLDNSRSSNNKSDIGNANRGHVKLHVTSKSNAQQNSLLKTWIRNTSNDFKMAELEESNNIALLSKISNDYINAYVQSWPAFGTKFADVKQMFSNKPVRTLAYDSTKLKTNFDQSYNDGNNNLIKLIPSTANILDIHMPTIQLFGINVPLCYYYLHATKKDSIGSMHDKYLGSIFDACCISNNCQPDEIIKLIHKKLDMKIGTDKDLNGNDIDFLQSMNIISDFLTQIATAGKYRSDYRISQTNKLISLESQDFDRITCASDSEDCEGVARATQEIAMIILNGRYDYNKNIPDCMNRDVMWNIWKKNNMWKGNGFWNHKGLEMCQRLLLHYTPVEILGSVTDAFPGMQSLREADIDDLDKAQYIWERNNRDSNLHSKIKNFIYGTEQNVEAISGAHQYSILMPLKNLINMYVKGFKLEENRDDSGTNILRRHPNDQFMVDKINKIHNLLSNDLPSNYPILPSLVLESTCRTSGYLVGSSYWQNIASGNTNEKQVKYEKKQRDWMNNVKHYRLMQKNVIQAKDLHTMKYVYGDLMNRRSSKFYRDVLHGTSIYLYNLLSGGDDAANTMTFSFINLSPQNGDINWGVPIEQVIRSENSVCVIPILHRINYSLRAAFHKISKWNVIPYFPPVIIGNHLPGDKSFAYPTTINLQKLTSILRDIHKPGSTTKSSVSDIEFNNFISNFKNIISDNMDSNVILNIINTNSISDRINNTRTYSVTLLSATIQGDWSRLIEFISKNNERITSIIYQRLIPVFGSQEIIVTTEVL